MKDSQQWLVTPRRSRWWKLALPAGLALVALVVAGLAYSSGGPNEQLAAQDRLYGGGGTDPGCFVPDIGFCRTVPIDFSIDAHATTTGQAAHGDFMNLNGHSQVTCIAVDGNNAVVGGVSVSGPDPSRIGWLFATFYVDRGTPDSGQRDLVSPNYGGPADPSGWPPGFPYVCPSPDTGVPEFGLIRSFIPISRGDIVIQDAKVSER
jgi:hypothetical protein